MSSSKYITILALAVLCAACNFGKHTFSFNQQDITDGFFLNIPAIAGDDDMGPHFPIEKVTKAHIYRARFNVRREESEGVIDYTVVPVNKKSDNNKDDFGYTVGNFQDIYLLQLETSPGSGQTPYIYFSAKYKAVSMNPDKPKFTSACLGFGPAYFGYYDNDINRIHFTKRLKIDASTGVFILESAGKKNFSFIADTIDDMDSIQVSKIIIHDANKVGGGKEILSSFDKIFISFSEIDFKYVDTYPYNKN